MTSAREVVMDTVPVPAPSRLLTCLVALLLLGGCGGTPTAQDASTPIASRTTISTTGSQSPGEPSSPDGPTTETFEEPQTEDPDVTEEAGGDGGGGVQVDLPGLPIGGTALQDETDPTWRCAEVNWTGSPEQPPVGVNLTITSLGVTPSDVYELTDGGCGAPGPCLDQPGVLTGGGQCAVSVRQVAANPDASGELFVTGGNISCAPGDEALCEQFLTDLDQNPQLARIGWSDGLTEWPSGDETTSSDTDDGTETTTGDTDDGTETTTGDTGDGTETTTGGTGDSTAPTETP